MARNRSLNEHLRATLLQEEIVAIGNFRFVRRSPNRASAVREFLRHGIGAGGKSALHKSPSAN
jgi:hypothetical protein